MRLRQSRKWNWLYVLFFFTCGEAARSRNCPSCSSSSCCCCSCLKDFSIFVKTTSNQPKSLLNLFVWFLWVVTKCDQVWPTKKHQKSHQNSCKITEMTDLTMGTCFRVNKKYFCVMTKCDQICGIFLFLSNLQFSHILSQENSVLLLIVLSSFSCQIAVFLKIAKPQVFEQSLFLFFLRRGLRV